MNVIKRVFDVAIAATLLVIFFPLLVIVSALVLFDGTGGGIFADAPDRVGLYGNEFRMFKFRTMIPRAHQKLLGELGKKQNRESKIRTDEDPRVTWIGKVLRKTDIDELPQVLNVLRGEMSIVGPRPYYREEIDRYLSKKKGGDYLFETILSVRPGMTGLWQVSGRNDIHLDGRVDMDVQYVDEWSILSDLIILIKTPWVVISRKGAW